MNNNPWIFVGPWVLTLVLLVVIFAAWFNS